VSGELGDADSRAASHDWHNLLTSMGLERFDHALATFAFGVGCALMLVALVWAAWVLHLQRRQIRRLDGPRL